MLCELGDVATTPEGATERGRRRAKPCAGASLGGRECVDGERGASIVEMALLLPILLLLLLGVIDFGRGYYLNTEVSAAASAGALYGAQSTTTAQDTAGIKAAAIADAPNVNGMTVPNVSLACQCSGSTASVSCTSPGCGSSSHIIEWLTVGTTAAYKPLFPYPGIPSSITLNGQATVRVGQP